MKKLYGEENEALLPPFERVKVDDINELLDAKGNPIPKESNMELLHRRYDKQDVQAIYRGIQKYKKAGLSYEQVIERCERDWFYFGINDERLDGRVSLMTILGVRWDMSLIHCQSQPYGTSRKNGDQLKSVPEGNGTMFDNTTIIYFPETGAGHHGPDTEARMVVMTVKIPSWISGDGLFDCHSTQPPVTRRWANGTPHCLTPRETRFNTMAILTWKCHGEDWTRQERSINCLPRWKSENGK